MAGASLKGSEGPIVERKRPERFEILVTDVEDPLPDATFGSIGRYVEVARPDGLDEAFVPQRLALGFDEEQAEHVDHWTLMVFEVELESRRFTPLDSSRVDVDEREVTAWVDHPGTYGLIGLPKHPGVLETLRLLDRYGPQLLEERERGEHGLQDRICGLILCADPTKWGGDPTGPGDPCAQCLGLDPSYGRLPERFLLLQRKPPLSWFPPHVAQPPPPPPGPPSILAWGRNRFGSLGDGSTVERLTPVWVIALATATKIVGSDDTTLALSPDGTVWSWGVDYRNPYANTSVPSRIAGLTNIVDIAQGGQHALAVRSDGSVWRWGSIEGYGVYGPYFDSYPVQVGGLSDAVAVAAGRGFSLVLTRDPLTGNTRVWSWGDGEFGILGDGSLGSVYRPHPALVPGLTAVRSIFAGPFSAWAIKVNGDVLAWGWPPLGDGGPNGSPTPVPVPGLSNTEQICGWHGLARNTAGEVWTWGDGDAGETGDGTRDWHFTPVRVPSLQNITAIAAGESHCMALQSNGTVWTWGSDGEGQVGDGGMAISARPTPFEVPLPAGRHASGIGAGVAFSFAILG
jgi:Regulator of chromosome condensation (RCC1) repeat